MCKRAPWLQRLRTLDQVERFVEMLSKNGFKEDQIAKLMISVPTHLTTRVSRLLEPKFQFFKEWGIQGEDLANILTSRPRILTSTLEQDLLPRMVILQNLFQSQDLFVKVVRKSPIVLTYDAKKTLKPSLAFWEGFGFSDWELAKLISSRPSLLQYSSLAPDKVDFFHKIDIDKGSKMYQYVLVSVVTYPMKTLEAKMQNLQLCGLSEEKAFELLRVCPKTLGFRVEKVSEVMDFIVNTMELPANSVVKYPKFLTMNLNRVIRPRFLVWRSLTSMYGRKYRKGLSLHVILFMPEKKFLSDVLNRRPALYPIYEMALANVSEFSSKV
ncbi:transcription termination factor MTERF4, chloroplastic [Cryptomeria japonica]|uniref:transcription termination factor MTERF4, chloroplastic n=1 Tax=Cryptomeria japonica TaxID=3369 RepID=UPI0027DA7AB1|nr:transcription termination factor MTERF4, chloroplastic [Cryptomeria japonica]